MLIKLDNELPEEIDRTAIYLPYLNIDDRNVSSILSKCDNFDEIIPVINKINDQNIVSIGPVTKVGKMYNRAGLMLDFSNFARAEVLFLVTYAAIKTKTRIILKYDIKQMELDTLKIYFKHFIELDKDNMVNIITDTYYYRDWLLELI